jgi:hypothetical protein
MGALQAFFLGIMVAWTPSLIVLTWIAYHARPPNKPLQR